MPLLEVDAVTVRFGGNLALDAVSFSAEPGCVTGLIGPNGAGKTTLFNVVSGLLAPTNGRVRLDGTDVTRLSPTRRARKGMARTFQRLELFTMLDVRENIRVAADTYRRWSRDRDDPDTRVEDIINRVGLRAVADVRTSALPTGQGRLVELARAMACNPKVLLLDEPAAGQDDDETARFAELLAGLATDGTAVVLVEHDMTLVMQACDPIHVLDFGEMLAVGSPEEIRSDPAVLEAYLGTTKTAGAEDR